MAVDVLIAAEFEPPPSLEQAWLDLLPPPRRARIAARREPRDRARSLLGMRLLAEGLIRLGHPPEALQSLDQLPGGRLVVAAPVEFSVSHADGMVACALSTAGPVGLDVEAVGDVTAEHFRLYLSDAERAWAGASPARFHAIWTRKEAVVKAAGTAGLAAIPAVDTTTGPEHASLGGTIWWTPALDVGAGYAAHLALAGGAQPISVTRVERATLERPLT